MTDRLLEFKVNLPQLEEEPGRFKGGVKRFRLQKNEGSPAFLLGGSGSAVGNSVSISSSGNFNSFSPGPYKQERLQRKFSGASPEPMLSRNVQRIRAPTKFSLNDPIHNGMLELLSHPAFRQPMFTKLRPKIQTNNPITGVSPKPSFSPEPVRRLIQTGARMMSVNKHINYS